MPPYICVLPRLPTLEMSMLTRKQSFLFLTPLALVLIPFLLWPALFGVVASFTNYEPFQRTALHFTGVANYVDVFHDHDFQASLRNIAIFTVVTVALELTLGLCIAYALRRPFRGRSLVRVVL